MGRPDSNDFNVSSREVSSMCSTSAVIYYLPPRKKKSKVPFSEIQTWLRVKAVSTGRLSLFVLKIVTSTLT